MWKACISPDGGKYYAALCILQIFRAFLFFYFPGRREVRESDLLTLECNLQTLTRKLFLIVPPIDKAVYPDFSPLFPRFCPLFRLFSNTHTHTHKQTKTDRCRQRSGSHKQFLCFHISSEIHFAFSFLLRSFFPFFFCFVMAAALYGFQFLIPSYMTKNFHIYQAVHMYSRGQKKYTYLSKKENNWK